MARIMIDAGHYGKYNHSPSVAEYWESDMSWALHLKLKAKLEEYGIEVGTTRNDKNADLDVYYRGKRAKGYDMFVSLHSNATGGGVNENCDHPIIIREYSDTNSEKWCQELSNNIAELMSTKQSGRTGTRLNDSGGEYYGVLRGAKAVGCNRAYIIEHSFHTATAPSKWLLVDSNLEKMATLEAQAIATHLGVEKKESEKDMTREETQALIDANKEQVYHYWNELPNWSRQLAYRAYKSGLWTGASATDLNCSASKLENVVMLARLADMTGNLIKVSDAEIKKVFG